MSLFKLSLTVFMTCVFLGFWVVDPLHVDVERVAALIVALALLLDK